MRLKGVQKTFVFCAPPFWYRLGKKLAEQSAIHSEKFVIAVPVLLIQ